MYTRPIAPLPIGGVLDDAIKLFRASFRKCFVFSLLGALVLGLFGIYIAIKFSSVLGGVAAGAQPQDPTRAIRAMGSVSGALFGSYILISLVSLVIYNGLFVHINDIATGAPARGHLAAFGVALRKLPGAVAAAIIFTVAIGVGFVLLLVPGIYLYGKLELWLAAMFSDDVGGIEALGNSWTATTGNWWRSVIAISVALIIILVLELLAGFIGAIVMGVMGLTHSVDPINITVATTIVRSALYIAILPMVPAVMLAIYNDLKLRRGGGDLAARAKSMQQPA